jgi:hypothetical protein
VSVLTDFQLPHPSSSKKAVPQMLIKIEACLHDGNTSTKQLLVSADLHFRPFWKLPAMEKIVSRPAHEAENAGHVQ